MDRADLEADTATVAQAQANRSRRRVAWRKGSEVDEELWPAETFGGVSDEQFWDDLASDKPLATTARTAAPPVPASRQRLPEIVPGRDVDDRGRADATRMAGGAVPGSGSGSGGYAPLAGRSGPADRTVIQPVQTGPQPTSASARSYQPGTQPQPYQAVAQSYQPATQPAPIASVAGQGGRAGQPALPADRRGRARMANGTDTGAGAGEDPLTSAAYALRPPGAVDGRSYQSARRSRDQYDAALSQETQAFSLADSQAATGGYPGSFRQFEPLAAGGGNGRSPEPRPDGVRSDPGRYDGLRSDALRSDALRSDPLRADLARADSLRSDGYWSGGRPDPLRGAGTADAYGNTGGHPYPERPYSDPPQPATAAPYGEIYGYGYPASPVEDPRQPNGTRGQGQSGGTGGWGARQSPPPGNGYRGPYDPRTNGRG